jgi:uncharacterized membrane protein
VHFPLAFLTLANVLNLLYGIVLYFPNNPFFSHDRENLSTLSILGYASNVLGIITSIPAVLTGGAELYAMIQSNGLYQTSEKGEKILVPKVKIARMNVSVLPVFWVIRVVIDTVQAGLNDLVVAGAVFNWLQERNVADFRPAGYQVVMSAILMVVQVYAAYLGGDLIYAHGVGVQRMGEAAKKKQR